MSAPGPKTRQKSCIPCAKSKRRCDMTYPMCSRCVSKFLHCEYKVAKPLAAGTGSSLSFPDESLSDILDISDHAMLLDDTSFLGDGRLDDVVDESFFEAFDNRLFQDPYSDVEVMDRERIKYIVRQLKTYPEKLFRDGRTAFVHPQSYSPEMSSTFQEACCAAALYSGKNENNEAMVWEIINSKVNQLMAPRTSWSVSEHMSSLQALIIFQIIRLFDGDIKQRSEAEQHEETLAQWTDQLSQRTGAIVSSGHIFPSTWESWVFEETVCRTIVISRMVQAMSSIQKQGFCTPIGAVTEISFTGQKALWEAPTAQHWQRACTEKNRFYARQMGLEEILLDATLDDLDDMGILMMVTYKGVDGVNEWIMRTGSTALIE